jgi:tetratricopeptide (TPR) repeat protein
VNNDFSEVVMLQNTLLKNLWRGLMIILPLFVFGTAFSQGVDKGCSPTVANPCTGSGSGSSGRSSSPRPTYRDTVTEEANARRMQAHNFNEDGVKAFNIGDFALALNLFMKAHQLAPDNVRINQNLENAQAMYNDQIRRQKEAEEAAKRNKAAVTAMQQSANALANSLTVSADDGLDFGSSINRVKPPDLEFTKDSNTPAPCGSGLTFGDYKTVDTRCIPSGLGKFIDDSIAKDFAKSPAGVSDRVRKGFQSLLVKDRSVALAWFKQALSLDPNNEGLKRVIELIEDTTKYQSSPKVLLSQPLYIDEKQASKELMDVLLSNIGYFPPPPVPANGLQLPQPDDISLLFMGKDVPTVFITFSDGTSHPYHPKPGEHIYLPDGPFTVEANGTLTPAVDKYELIEWKRRYKDGNYDRLLPPPNPVKKP